MADFAHLHVHTEYSLLDGACRLDDLFKKAKNLQMKAVGITDHGVMYGAVEFFEKAQNFNIKPIIGCEVYVAKRTRWDKTPKLDDDLSHFLLLAKDQTGYLNLLKLVALSNLEGFYYKPRVDRELLERYSSGLIAASSCLKGEIPQAILKGRINEAIEKIGTYQEIFGKENFYLELQDNLLPEQKKVNSELINLSKRLYAPLVATNDVHYLERSDARMHDILLCIQTQKTLEDPSRLKFGSSEFYFKTPEEMQVLFSEIPDALNNTLEIAERCNVSLGFDKNYLPDFKPPEGYTLESFLEELCYKSLPVKYPHITEDIKVRLNSELSVIKAKELAAYFLIVWDFIKFAKSHQIPVGPGRGSAAGSLVAYLLDITEIDPLKYGLIFERFLNPDRMALPDIDTDFCIKRRDEVIRYVTSKYGKDRVSQIITFGKMKARAAIRDTGRVLSIPLNYVDKIAKLIPPGFNITDALGSPEFNTVYKKDKEAKYLIDMAKSLEGLSRNASIHAAGVVISKEPLTNYVPLQKMAGNEIVAQYEMNSIAKIGLLKMDFLGLRNLTVIDGAVKLIKENQGTEVNLSKIPLDDKKTYKLLQRAQTQGVFQLESSGMRRYLKQLKPERFEDIIALLALYRPGTLIGGTIDDFMKIRRGRGKVKYLHPRLEPILKETNGVIVYQEQVMQIANQLADYSMAQADELRAAMGKKKPEVMAEHREIFVSGCQKNGVDKKVATKIFDFIEYFAGYGFNKSHATAYALISYQTAYLKANYPREYMAALLTSIIDYTDKVALFVRECKSLGIQILVPDINESFIEFTVTADGIRWGLAAIKNVGKSAIESIVRSRESKGEFKSIFDFCSRVDLRLVNKRVLESLIKSGAFDKLGSSRASLISLVDQALDFGSKVQKEIRRGQISLFGQEETLSILEPASCSQDNLKPDDEDKLLKEEKEVLGIYLTSHPLQGVKNLCEQIGPVKINELLEIGKDKVVTLAGIISTYKKIVTRTNQTMAFLQLEDFTGTVEVVILPKAYERVSNLLIEDNLIVVEGRIETKEKFVLDQTEEPSEEAKIIAENIYNLKDYKSKSPVKLPQNSKEKAYAAYHIKINSYQRSFLTELKDIVKSYRGDKEVYLHLEDDLHKPTLLKLNSNCRVCDSEEFVEKVQGLLGKQAVWKK